MYSNKTPHCWSARTTRLLRSLSLLLALLPATQGSHGEALTDAQARSHFLLNFLRFTTWPPAEAGKGGAARMVCLLGAEDDLEAAMAEVKGSTAGGRPIEVRRQVSTNELGGCSLVYVPDNQLYRLADIRHAIGMQAVLIVGESEAVLERGGTIALKSTDRHLTFIVNLASARRVGMQFAPQMLQSAERVLH